MVKEERILCAAIWYKDLPTQRFLAKNQDRGVIICGHRHGQCIDIIKTLCNLRTVKISPDGVGETVQGFLTNENRFVDREEAGKIAFESFQIESPTDNLFSEDLY